MLTPDIRVSAMTKLRFFLDSEFNEHVQPFMLDPISIALVPEDAAKPGYYGVSAEFNTAAITPWLNENVVRHLPPAEARRSNAQIRDDIAGYLKTFAGSADAPVTAVEIWAYNGGTDQVVLANFFGGLMGLRAAFKEAGLPTPQFRDVKELSRAAPPYHLPLPENAHDCHADAVWARDLFAQLKAKLPPERRFLID